MTALPKLVPAQVPVVRIEERVVEIPEVKVEIRVREVARARGTPPGLVDRVPRTGSQDEVQNQVKWMGTPPNGWILEQTATQIRIFHHMSMKKPRARGPARRVQG